MHWRPLHRQHQPAYIGCPAADDKQSYNDNDQEARADHIKQEARANTYNHFEEAGTPQIKYEASTNVDHHDQEA